MEQKNALISVYDKTNLKFFVESLLEANYRVFSTGGTYKEINKFTNNIHRIEEITNFPEILDGRVKTLHPSIFAGILANQYNIEHLNQLRKFNISEFSLVVVNLYPFAETVKKSGTTIDEAIEQIDIGGVSLIRAAAKNYNSVCVLVSPDQYYNYIKLLKENNFEIPQTNRLKYSSDAFNYIADYDINIAKYFINISENKDFDIIRLKNSYTLRYGENPHQTAVLYKDFFDDYINVVHGKELSYNNLLDMDAAINIIREFENDNPTCCIIKHGNPCGVASEEKLDGAFLSALSTDNISPYGGILIFNREIDYKTAEEIDKIFTEIILAPDFEYEALKLLSKKKNRRLVKYRLQDVFYSYRSIYGGILKQSCDNTVVDYNNLLTVTNNKPDEKLISDLIFAFKVVKHVKSNAVVFAKDKKTLGIGGGQPSRVDSTKIAIKKAEEFGHDLQNSVVASDAFFPFADSLKEIVKAGANAVIQPGGSIRDDEVIKEADNNNLVMVFTKIRHFRH